MRRSRLRWPAVALLLLALLPAQGAAQAPAQGAAPRPLSELGARVAYHAETGRARFVAADPGSPFARPAWLPADASPETAGRAFLASYGALFGLRDQADELALLRQHEDRRGASLRFQQRYQQVPVLAGELTVQLDPQHNVTVASGEILPDLRLDTRPALAAEEARAQALAAVARAYALPAAELRATAPALTIYSPALLGGPGPRIARLTWRLEVRGARADAAIRELVLIDAQRGGVALQFSQIAHGRQRHVCDSANIPDSDGDQRSSCQPASYLRSEGGAATGISEVDRAYDYSGSVYDYYLSRFGRDSIDGAGMPLISLVRYCPTGASCPYRNAFWDGLQMTYGDGFVVDDVVAHELTHGVTEYTAGLFYYYQSGAINESLSDVLGELIDQANGLGTDTPAVRWQLGEDMPAAVGIIRDMRDPTIYGDPDRTGSPLYYGGKQDSGGVHSNSGVSNKAAFLMTDGGSFNGYTVSGIGAERTAQIYYRTMTSYLTSGSDYQDLGEALPAACAELVGVSGITAEHCAEVGKVVLATQMLTPPASAPALRAELCPAGGAPLTLLLDDFESGLGQWSRAAISGPSRWRLDAPYGAYARSGVHALYGLDAPGATSDSVAAMASSVSIPAGAYLHFAHAYGFENSGWDGGVLEYSVDGGASWQDAGGMFEVNGYDGPLQSANPLGVRQAFRDDSRGYIESRLSLAALAGQSARFRFRMGLDSSVSDAGWWVDDLRIYTCGGPELTGVEPGGGAVGAEVTISGVNLGDASVVTFGGASASFTVVSATQITASVPAAATSGLIRVATPSGVAESARAFVVATGRLALPVAMRP